MDAQADAGSGLAFLGGDLVFRILDGGEDLPGIPQQDAPVFVEMHAPAAAVEQGGTQLVLQILNGPAQSRLGKVQPLGRLGHVLQLGHGLKLDQLKNFHGTNTSALRVQTGVFV